MQLEQRVEMITDLVEKYKQGADINQVKREAKAVFAFVRPDEIKAAENQLASRQLRPEDLHELHRLHLDNLHNELQQFREAIEPWHPIRTMLEEHEQILKSLEVLESLNGKVQQAGSLDMQVVKELARVAENLLAAEPHHLREEEVVFPELTRRGIGATVEAMHEEHTELREKKHALQDLVGQASLLDFGQFKQDLDEIAQYLVYNLSDHIYKENYIMFPAAVRMVEDKNLWPELKRRCDEIGYCNFKPVH